MFDRMNRRLYHTLRIWLVVLAYIAGIAVMIAGFIWMLSQVEAQYGVKGVAVFILLQAILGISLSGSYLAAENAVEKEEEKKRNVEKSLKHKW